MYIKSLTANVLHLLLVAGQYANAATGVIPQKYQPCVAGALGLLQLAIGRLQHVSPPPVK
jgi:hypothetical protein